jgi:TetR/AcrR family transcriptional repressor of nem operon
MLVRRSCRAATLSCGGAPEQLDLEIPYASLSQPSDLDMVTMPRTSDKRERLVNSADALILQQGFKQTTLADIAENSGVPLGNVYYYFKSKEDIGKTVIERRLTNLRQLLSNCSRADAPKARLNAMLDYPLQIQDSLTLNGCPLGTLAYELSHTDSFLREASKQLIQEILDWSTEQFTQMGKADADLLGLQFVSDLQGMSLIANALGDRTVVTRMVERLREWVAKL